jgi:hypothetical protein
MEVRSVLWLSAVARFGERIPNSLDANEDPANVSSNPHREGAHAEFLDFSSKDELLRTLLKQE